MMRRQSILEKIQNLAHENKEVPCYQSLSLLDWYSPSSMTTYSELEKGVRACRGKRYLQFSYLDVSPLNRLIGSACFQQRRSCRSSAKYYIERFDREEFDFTERNKSNFNCDVYPLGFLLRYLIWFFLSLHACTATMIHLNWSSLLMILPFLPSLQHWRLLHWHIDQLFSLLPSIDPSCRYLTLVVWEIPGP